MRIAYTDEFRKTFRKQDSQTQHRLVKHIKTLLEYPLRGKPLRNRWKGCRTLRTGPYRILYKIEGERIIILSFRHRSDAY